MHRLATCCILLIILGMALGGCGRDKEPAGPDNGVPVFEVRLEPAEITPPQNAQVKLFATFPEFNQLDGKMAYFSSSSSDGFFNYHDSSRVSLQAPDGGNLDPSVWYGYIGEGHDLTDTVHVSIEDFYGSVLAWNYGTILVH